MTPPSSLTFLVQRCDPSATYTYDSDSTAVGMTKWADLALLVSGDATIMDPEQSRWSACDQNLLVYLCQLSTLDCASLPNLLTLFKTMIGYCSHCQRSVIRFEDFCHCYLLHCEFQPDFVIL